jgi:hypothetical protein
MFLRGINYDIGTPFWKDELSRPDFIEADVKAEIEIIKNELRCDAVRISGYDVGRLAKAAEFALEQGIQVWLSPAYPDITQKEAIRYWIDCAKAAEKLREKYKDIIFIVGCEHTLFLKGFVKGETAYERIDNMFSPLMIVLNKIGLKKSIYKKLNLFLKDATTQIRAHFGGQLSYAAGGWEKVDWSLFDFVGIDHYMAAYNKSTYVQELRSYYKFNKPVAMLEFGCCAYKGAADKGPMGWAINGMVDGRRIIKGSYVRDESEQASYITGVLDLLKEEKLQAVFVFTFSNPAYKYNKDPVYDLDLASYGIVKPVDESAYKGLHWVPKESFYRLADYYGGLKEKA